MLGSLFCGIGKALGGCEFTPAKEPTDSLPAPPHSLKTIDGNRMRAILESVGLRDIHLGSWQYELSSIEEYTRFLKWYHDKHPYSLDEYDCNVFALVLHAEAAKWMDGKFAWGHIWAEGIDEDYEFPNHGFNLVVDYNEHVYFCDELELAAPGDEFVPAYAVKSNLVEL